MPKYLFGLLTGCFLILSGFSYRDARSYYEDGLLRLEQKNYVQAIGDFTSAISLSPNYADAYFQRANAKQMLADQLGFAGSEQCADWLRAFKLGKPEAARKLLQGCGNVCETAIRIDTAESEYIFCVDWSGRQLAVLPTEVSALQNLLRLDISDNALRRLNDLSLSNNLFGLDASKNKLTELPATVGNYRDLNDLNLSHNQLRALPSSIGELHDLKQLYLRNNDIRQLPNSVSGLSNLEYLDLSFNALRRLPAGFEKLTNLRHLLLTGNPIPAAEQEKIRCMLPACSIRFDE